MKYSLGLDLGVASIGWAIVKLDENDSVLRIEDLGVRLFDAMEKGKTDELENAIRREKRGSRRLIRRRSQRLRDLNKYFIDNFKIDIKEIDLSIVSQQFAGEEHTLLPYRLKIKGLNEKLSLEELAIISYHYCKHRGFKSNRKSEDKKSDGVLISGIENTEKTLTNRGITITNFLLETFKDNKQIRNKDKYLHAISRSMYETEFSLILDKQIESGLINNNFKDRMLNKEKYLNCFFNRQRDFSEGPGKGSKFGGQNGKSLIEQMLGNCQFYKEELRAPKGGLSAAKFVFLSHLNNITYTNENNETKRLSQEQINNLLKKALETRVFSYNTIKKEIGLETVYFNMLKNKKGEIKDLLEEKIKFFETYHDQKKILKKHLTTKEIEILKDEDFDHFSDVLLKYRTEAKFDENLKDYSEKIIKAVKEMEPITKTIDLSSKVCRELIPYQLEAMTYDKAVKAIGFNHSDRDQKANNKYIPKLDGECGLFEKLTLEITNPNVKHILFEARKLINALIKDYGKPYIINIESARDIAKIKSERGKIERENEKNAKRNFRTREKLFETGRFTSFAAVSPNDVIKQRLFDEQKGICIYCGEQFQESRLFELNSYQIDHIVPYSASFNDQYDNKALVCTKCNQEKKNRIPLHFLNENQAKNFLYRVNSNRNISGKKRDNFIRKELPEAEFGERDINNLRYANKTILRIIKASLGYSDKDILFIEGQMTNFLKKRWGLSRLTHSLKAKDMNKNRTYYLEHNFCEFNEDKITVNLTYENNKLIFELKKEKAKANRELEEQPKRLNELIDFAIENKTLFIERIGFNKNLSLEELCLYFGEQRYRAQDENNNILYEKILQFLLELISRIEAENRNKERDNHLHHACDAVVLACVTRSTTQKITNHYKYEKNKDFLDLSTEEIKEIYGEHPERFPRPYPEFVQDVKERVFQRDIDKLKEYVRKSKIYLDRCERFNKNLTIIYPSRSPLLKTSGPLHKETFFGYKPNFQTLTKRVSVQKLSIENVEDIFDKNGGNHAVYLACKAWMKNGKTGLPTIQKGSEIRKIEKVKLDLYSDIKDEAQRKEKIASKVRFDVKINGNKNNTFPVFADSENVLIIEVYKKKNSDGSLYYCPLNAFKINNAKNENIQYQLFTGQGVNNLHILSKKELNEGYQKLLSIRKNSMLEIELKNGNKSYCYSVGATSGMMEVASSLGDNYDIVGENTLFKNFCKSQYYLTVSTIKSIKVRNISLLGKIT
ncbi:MAG: type II CRISPR RNA-guided endonuclease Cas9 [Erysipelotrichales bacterium]|nr:type II CRISPR RNA-guided endonuclease Cas9 [Erysipelotrichales bacterium]